ncbi:hypothetical protein J5J86_21010 [Aquabacter sp. L1I39]|uniref:hypothetical protein n=1 Tax=Aquabacter sp. L1I39 TaxID=2820278 RepID=UPI001ADC9C25|nr:hypothetical protein [Aquabacter sp. L1I39]QTL03202.1 hypothetical protein J5J86_21010 [Aquabacter sp. L1I39]
MTSTGVTSPDVTRPAVTRRADILRYTPKTFLIWAPPYTHTSSGIRALYRLCHHLNVSGYPSALLAEPGHPLPHWNCFLHEGPVDDAILVYPEIVSGNPCGAGRVVRWALNTPGLIGGDTHYPETEMVFFYDPQKRADVQRAVAEPLGPERVLWLGLVDPAHIYPDPAVPKTLDCSFVYKGAPLAERFPLPAGRIIEPLESLTPNMAALGETLRRTRTLYSYDHYSNLLREAAICGCDVRVVDEHGTWHDPRTCDCPLNILWDADLLATYAGKFHSSAFVAPFILELRRRWDVPPPNPWWKAILPFPAR